MKYARLYSSLCLLLLAASANAAEADITVPFAPSASAWTRDFRMIATVTIDGQPGPTTSVRTVRRQEIRPKGGGWVLISTPDIVEINGVESPLDRAIQTILLGQQFTLHLDAQGQLLSVEGFDLMAEEVKKNIPREARQSVSQVLNAETQRWRLANQWETENAWLYGKPLTPGAEYTLEKKLTPPDGPAMQFSQQSTASPDKRKDSLLVRFVSQANPTADADLRQLTSLVVTEKGERRFALDSGLPLAESSTRRIEVTYRSEEGLMPQVREETRHIVYTPVSE